MLPVSVHVPGEGPEALAGLTAATVNTAEAPTDTIIARANGTSSEVAFDARPLPNPVMTAAFEVSFWCRSPLVQLRP